MILPNGIEVLSVNMRCTRVAVGQYEVACRGDRTCSKSVRFFMLVLPLFSLHYFLGELVLSHIFFLLTYVYLFLMFFKGICFEPSR